MTPPLGSKPQPLVQSPEPGSHLCQMQSLRPLRLFPGLNLVVLAWFTTGQGRKQVGLVLGRAGKKPQVVFSGFTVIGTRGRDICFSIYIRWIIIYVCKIYRLCTLPKCFIHVQSHALYWGHSGMPGYGRFAVLSAGKPREF